MGRRSVRCSEKHTPLNPGKDRVRAHWVRTLRQDSKVLTISHGALGVLDILQHPGPVQVIDIDPGVIESTEYMRESDYPGLRMAPPRLVSIQEYVRRQVMAHGTKAFRRHDVIDADLADCIETCFPIVEEVIRTLVFHNVHTRVLFTFRNGRDCHRGTDSRMQWLRQRLPLGAKLISSQEYYSGRIREDASRKHGSIMCLAEIHT